MALPRYCRPATDAALNIAAIAGMTSVVFIAPCAHAAEADLPDIARALIHAAAETGNADEVRAVANATIDVFAEDADAIREYAGAILADLTANEIAVTEAGTTDGSDGTETPSAAPSSNGVFSLAPWEGRIGASAVSASGNSDNLAIGVLLDAKRETGAFTHNVTGYFDIGESTNVVNQRRWGAAYKLDYAIADRAYAFGRIAYDEDEFSGFDYRLFFGGGVGYFFAKSDPFTWKVEAGPGYRISPIDDTRETDRDFAFYGASETDWLIREGLLFEQNFGATYTDPTSTFESTTSLTTKIWEGLSTGVSYYYRFETNPPLGRQRTDQVIRATIGYDF